MTIDFVGKVKAVRTDSVVIETINGGEIELDLPDSSPYVELLIRAATRNIDVIFLLKGRSIEMAELAKKSKHKKKS